VKREKGARERLEKRRGTSASLYLAKGRLADETGGKGGHGAAKPEGVIHRYISNHSIVDAIVDAIVDPFGGCTTDNAMFEPMSSSGCRQTPHSRNQRHIGHFNEPDCTTVVQAD
jgi:hypothetical protein